MGVKLNANQILEIIKENYSERSFAYNYWLNTDKVEVPEGIGEEEQWVLDYLGLGEVEEVAQYGGEEQGTTWYSVKYFKDHDVYIRIDGYYTSYNGADFYDGYGREVVPTEKTVVVFE